METGVEFKLLEVMDQAYVDTTFFLHVGINQTQPPVGRFINCVSTRTPV